MAKSYTKKEKNMYLLGMTGQNILFSVVNTGLFYYFQSVIFIPAMAISLILTVTRIWDAVKDPIMGVIVDNTRSKWGKCRPYLLFSPPFVCIATLLTFANGIYGAGNTSRVNTLIILWASISYVLWGLAFTVADVPLWGITSLMTGDAEQRSGLIAASKMVSSIAGATVMTALVPVAQVIGGIFSESMGDNTKGLQYGFLSMVIPLTLVGALFFQFAGIFVKEHVVPSSEEKHSVKESFVLMWRCKPFRQVFISGLLRSPMYLLNSVMMTLLAYYYGDNGRTFYMHYYLILGGGNLIGQFAAMACSQALLKRFEKEKLFIYGSIATAIASAALFVPYLIAPTELHRPFWVAVLFVLFTGSGLGFGLLNVVQTVMIADAVDYEEYHNHYRPDAVLLSGQSVITKVSMGVASVFTGIVFSFVGFSGDAVRAVNDALYAGASFKLDPMFAPYRAAMFFLCTIPPAVGLLLSVIPIRRYALPDREHKRILNELNRKRSEREESV